MGCLQYARLEELDDEEVRSAIPVKPCLVGGLEHFLFSHILEIIIPSDVHIFQRGSNHQPGVI